MRRIKGLGWLPGVEVRPDLALVNNAVETGLILVALPLVAIEVVPAREGVMAEAAGERGAILLAHEPLLVTWLAGAAEVHGGPPEGSLVPEARHAGSRLPI